MDLIEAGADTSRRHPWELARFDFFHRVLQSGLVAVPPRSVLDIGAGDGWFSESLGSHLGAESQIVCWDANYTDEHLKPFGGAAVDRMTFTREPPDGTYDLVLLMDVLEHIEDDHGFLHDAAKSHMTAGTRILISVPAWPVLYSRHDAHFGHYRRYTPRAARAVIQGAGLQILRAGGLFHGLLPVRALMIMMEHHRRDHAEIRGLGGWEHGPLLTSALVAALRAEGVVSRLLSSAGIELPGLSWWALCEKPNS